MVSGFQHDRWDKGTSAQQGKADGGPAIYPLRVNALIPIEAADGEDERPFSRSGRYNLRNSRSFRAAQSSLSPFVLDRLIGDGYVDSRRFSEEVATVNSVETDEALFGWGVLENGHAIIVSCELKERSLHIPAELEGHPVTALGSHSFSLCYDLEEVILPDSILEIGEYAFMNTALKSFRAPESLCGIGVKAFYRCRDLATAVFDEALVYIGDSAFEHTALSSVEVPASVAYLGVDAFKGTAITYGDESTLHLAAGSPYEVMDGALYWHDGEDLVLMQVLDQSIEAYYGPEGLTAVGKNAFFRLPELAEVHLPEGVVYIGPAAFKGCAKLTSIELPPTLLSIEKEAILDTNVASLHLPASLEYLGLAALCTVSALSREIPPALKEVTIEPGNEHFYLEGGVLYERRPETGDKAILYVGPEREVSIPDHVTSIGPYAFANISGIRDIELHDGIEVIDAGGLFLSGTPPMLHVRSAEAEGGRYDIRFPQGGAGLSALRTAFSGGHINIPEMYISADRAVLSISDVAERSRIMVGRLLRPVFLRPPVANIFRERLERSVVASCVAFANVSYLRGFTELEELGLLTTHNIDEAIAAVSEEGEPAAVNALLDIRRRVFNLPVFDFDL